MYIYVHIIYIYIYIYTYIYSINHSFSILSGAWVQATTHTCTCRFFGARVCIFLHHYGW